MKTTINIHFKQNVLQHCKYILEQRIATAKVAMHAAQEAANSEDKSSAGDKYETSRAMGQLARDMNAKQLAEAQSELNILFKINFDVKSDRVIQGSIIHTANEIYFIAAGIGNLEIDKQKVIVLSPKSPLAIALTGKKAGDEILFNTKKIVIKNIF